MTLTIFQLTASYLIPYVGRMGIGRVKFPYKSVPESTSSKKKRRRNGKADPSETSTSDHSDDPQNPEARVTAKSTKRFQASEAGRSHPPPSFPSPFSTQANLAAEKNLEILIKNDDQSSAFSSLAGALGNLPTDLSSVSSNSEPALSTGSLGPSAMPQLSSALSHPAGSLLHNYTGAGGQLEDINGSLHTGSQHSTAVKVQSNIPEWRRQSPPKLDTFKSNKRLRDDEYTRCRIVQISTITNQKTHEGWRGHPDVILGTWGDLVAVCASSTWSSCGGRNDKFGQVDGIQERELRLRFFPLLKYVNKLDYEKYGMLNFEGSEEHITGQVLARYSCMPLCPQVAAREVYGKGHNRQGSLTH